ncbi:biotin/lipoyl-binding carrier protein [Lipingzhangella sp. LS1_29]|uniref:Biotin/lipoyl-binding carrier protein n=1 Tax=Lipingzhangella rawalii TaxID=2055835 RepID=A0ABU2H9V3_9ACTN|nr:biotin/lipoyl-binding carrier protein [Lipingzhangella rawalii]MDS1272068.1 biotin/lipoyl-binding carrier protein [Lipingzhangella rawalii]
MAEIRAELVANVWKVTASSGATLRAGEPVLILESMKMEIPVLTEDPGIVRSIRVAEGDVVQEGELLAVVE